MYDYDSLEELKLMVRCAQLFYTNPIEQSEIAKQLGISPTKVSRLLKRARADGLVRIEIPEIPRLASELVSRYTLRDAVVIPRSEVELKKALGAVGARYFEKIAHDGATVGLSCGLSLFNVVQQLKDGLFRNLRIYPLSVELTLENVDIFPNTLVGIMATHYREPGPVYAHALNTSLAARSKEEQAAPAARRVFNEAGNVSIALLGIGSIGKSTPGFCALAESVDVSVEDLRKEGAVGEINYQPFNREGVIIKHGKLMRKLVDRVIAVSAERLGELAKGGNHVIAIAGGSDKIDAIAGALAGHFINVLITDDEVARALIARPSK